MVTKNKNIIKNLIEMWLQNINFELARPVSSIFDTSTINKNIDNRLYNEIPTKFNTWGFISLCVECVPIVPTSK